LRVFVFTHDVKCLNRNLENENNILGCIFCLMGRIAAHLGPQFFVQTFLSRSLNERTGLIWNGIKKSETLLASLILLKPYLIHSHFSPLSLLSAVNSLDPSSRSSRRVSSIDHRPHRTPIPCEIRWSTPPTFSLGHAREKSGQRRTSRRRRHRDAARAGRPDCGGWVAGR
jgi:hypothetical protein